MLKSKKGIALNQAFGAILVLVLVSVLVIVAILLFSNLISGVFTGLSGTQETVTDESLTPTFAGAAVANSTACGFAAFSIVTATNSSGTLITSGNYTTSASAGTVVNTTSLTGTMVAPWLLNYTHTSGGPACVATQGMITQFATYPALIGLVGTIIFLGLVIGVLVASFVFGGKQGI